MRKKEFDSKISQPGERGFSMIEMLIAIVVVTFGLVSVVGISGYVSRANSISATLNMLAAAAQDQVDRLRTARWTPTLTDPMLTVGGSVPAVAGMSGSEPTFLNRLQPETAYMLTTPTPYPSPTPTPTPYPEPVPVGATYTYTLDPDNPHHATASGTPVGDLNITWQVRQGALPDIRYVTINVTQINPPANLANGFTVTTIIVRN
jgi:prepilin-type N-terminal cleavage/methylation domain-containing protein